MTSTVVIQTVRHRAWIDRHCQYANAVLYEYVVRETSSYCTVVMILPACYTADALSFVADLPNHDC